MTIHVSNPDAIQNADGTWHHIADLTLPDGTAGHLDQTITHAAQLYYEGVIPEATEPAMRENGATGPVTHTDVTRLLGVIAIGDLLRDPPPAAPTTYSGTDLTA